MELTVTIKNTLTGDKAADIKGVKVEVRSSPSVYPVGSGSSYDTSYTVTANGPPVTLPPFTIRLSYGRYVEALIGVDLGEGKSAYGRLGPAKPPSAVTLDLAYGIHGSLEEHYLKQTN